MHSNSIGSYKKTCQSVHYEHNFHMKLKDVPSLEKNRTQKKRPRELFSMYSKRETDLLKKGKELGLQKKPLKITAVVSLLVTEEQPRFLSFM